MSDPTIFVLFASIVQPLVDGADSILNFFHDDVGLAWGTSIIALTVVIRTLLIPLTYKQIKGMRALQALQPEIKKLQEKYKNDRQRQQQEMMRFWQSNKINPLSSCLPLLLQLPVFFALFELLRSDSFKEEVLASGGQSWMFIDSVVQDPGFSLEGIILIVLFMGSMALSSLVMIRTSPSGAGNQQYILLGAFALMGVFFVPTFPAGLSIYWITTNFWTVGQQYAATKLIPAPAAPTPEEEKTAKPPPPPPRKRKKRR
jgi:YidC/Oxa1 family membrane protein insertase